MILNQNGRFMLSLLFITIIFTQHYEWNYFNKQGYLTLSIVSASLNSIGAWPPH